MLKKGDTVTLRVSYVEDTSEEGPDASDELPEDPVSDDNETVIGGTLE